MKADWHAALVPIDLQTQEGYLIDSKYVHLYHILTRLSEKISLTTVIKGLQETINNELTIQLE